MKEEIEPFENEALLEQLVNCQRYILLGRLSTMITHEFNNHLTGVCGYAQLLLGRAGAEAFEKELNKINFSANRCRNLIGKIRQLGRFTNGTKEFDNVNLILKSSLDLVHHQFERKSATVVEDFSPDVPSIKVDAAAMEQVFLNVLQNALEAFPEKGNCLTVTTRTEGEAVVVTFEDDGVGLSEEARTNLFTPFFTTKAELNCPGLGLTAAKMVAEAHGGTITVESSSTGGARAIISLPIESAE